MRGPDERSAPEGPAEHKVWERLHQFELERGFEVDEASPGEAEERPHTDMAVARAYGAAARTLAETSAEAAEPAPVAPAADQATDAQPQAQPQSQAPLWRSLGPRRMDNGQTYGDTRISVSGRVSSLAVDPSNRNRILCGSAAGGVWLSSDRGATWAPRTDSAPTLTVGAIAFDPSSPTTVYAGTGEGNFYAGLGQGLLRSDDGGESWTLIARHDFIGTGFFDLAVDPGNGRRILAATSAGLWLSTDAGSSWSRRRTSRCWKLSIARPAAGDAEILAACQDGLFRSNDGLTWTAVQLPGGSGSFVRLAVSHAPSDPTVAYAFGSFNGVRRLWRRSAGAWQSFEVPADRTTEQDWYNWFLAAAPDRSGQIYIGGVEAWRGDLAGSAWTWTRISNKSGQDIHPDQHAIAFDPDDPAAILIGNDGGLYRSPDRGVSWQSLNDGLEITEIEYIAQDHGSARWLIGGTQDNGSIRFRGSAVWDHIADGDGGDCGVDRTNPSRVYHTYYGMGVQRSNNGGEFGSFGGIGPAVPSGYRCLFYPPMEVNGATVAQAGATLFVSRSSGSSWQQIALPGGMATALHMPTPDLIYLGTDDGRLFRFRWTGTGWGPPQPLTMPRPGAWISDIHASADGSRLWVSSTRIHGPRIFLSMDGGTSWADRSAGLPNIPLNAIESDPSDAARVWVAADLGVYETRNSGLSWSVFGLGLPNVLVADMLFHPHARLLRVGTRNRGVWEIAVDGDQREPVCAVQFTGSVAANRTQRWVTNGWPATWHVIWTVMPTTVRPGAAQISAKVQAERADPERVTYSIVVTNHTNQPVAFEGRSAILSRA